LREQGTELALLALLVLALLALREQGTELALLALLVQAADMLC
jgi:hypothetical protein